ncbi:helix-turn-helix domain-containing protein [candidate division KSB1 bacterium]
MKFWKLISDEMDKVGLNKKRLADMAGMSRSTLNVLEQGKEPSPDNRMKLEAAFGYTIMKKGKDDYEWDAKIWDAQSEEVLKLKKMPANYRLFKSTHSKVNIRRKGLIDFKNSKDWMIANISDDEEEWLESIFFRPEKNPSAETYKDLLLIYRKLQ